MEIALERIRATKKVIREDTVPLLHRSALAQAYRLGLHAAPPQVVRLLELEENA